MLRMVAIIGCLGLISSIALGDIVHLKDGRTVEGAVKRSDDGWEVTQSDGQIIPVARDQVVRIELAPKSPEDTGQARLDSLRRSVTNLSDLAMIIERYERLIEQLKGSEASADAEADLALWKQRQADGLVKVGGQWVTAEQKAAMQRAALGLVEKARQLLKQGRLREADEQITAALEADPQNASALYLRGLASYRQDQLQPARRAFEQVNETVPNHAPTLNNLAVILWRLNALTASLNFYDQAMLSAPQNPLILNNVAEAIAQLTPEQRETAPAKKLSRRFVEQDTELQKKMAQNGLYRWGSGWVDQKQLDELRAAEKQVKEMLDAMSKDFDAATASIQRLEQEIDAARRRMRDIESMSVVVGQDGRIYRTALPPVYYEFQRDIDRFQVERRELMAKQEAMKKEVVAVQQRMPTPQFTGIQQVVDVEGTPLILPEAPPTTRP